MTIAFNRSSNRITVVGKTASDMSRLRQIMEDMTLRQVFYLSEVQPKAITVHFPMVELGYIAQMDAFIGKFRTSEG